VARESGNLIDLTKGDDEMPEVEKEEFYEDADGG
jgi:hypothetical protein